MLRKTVWDEDERPEPGPGETGSLIDYGLAVDRKATGAGGAGENSTHAHFSVSLPRA